MDLYKLPKDILIEIIKKTYDFSKLSIEDVDKLHSSLHDKFRQRYMDEMNKNNNLMEKIYVAGDLNIKMNTMRNIILVGNIFKIRFHSNEYELNYRFSEFYDSEEELIVRARDIIQWPKTCKDVEEIISIIKSLIKFFESNKKISNIFHKYFMFSN